MSFTMGFEIKSVPRNGDGSLNLSQMDIAALIMQYLEKAHGVKNLHSYQLNAILEASTNIVLEMTRPHVSAVPNMGLDAWRRCDDTGLSSLFMASAIHAGLNGFKPLECYHYPHDAADFNRCLKMLEAVPEFKPHRELVRPHGVHWARLLDQWDRIEAAIAAGDHHLADIMVQQAVAY